MLNVLVIEDDAPVREILVSMVSAVFPDALVAAVSCGADALKASRERLPDLLVIDLGLPDMSGFEAWSALLQLGFSGRAIVATADDMPVSRARAAALGAAAYITKPFSGRELQGVLRALHPV